MAKLFAIAVLAVAMVAACEKPEGTAPPVPGEPAAAAAAPSREEVVAHGKYIVENLGMCGDCHTPFTPEGQPDISKSLHGAVLAFAPTDPATPFKALSPALAGLPQGCTEQTLALFLQNGSACDNTLPLPPMPSFRMNEADAKAVAAYLASLPKPAPPQ